MRDSPTSLSAEIPDREESSAVPAHGRAIVETLDEPGSVAIHRLEIEVLAGPAIEALSEPELARRVEDVAVYARVTPEHKLRIVRAFLGAMVASGSLIAGCTLAAFAFGLLREGSLEKARTYAFSTLVVGEVLRAFASRSRDRILWEIGAFSNFRLALVAFAIVGFQVFTHHAPFLERFLHSGQLTWAECLGVTAVAFVPVSVLELRKLLRWFLLRQSPAA